FNYFLPVIFYGLLLAIFLAIVWFFKSRNEKITVFEKATWKKRWKSSRRAFLALLLPLFIIFGLRGGIFTPTEAGVFAAIYSLVISLIYREIKLKSLGSTLVNSAKTTGIDVFLA